MSLATDLLAAAADARTRAHAPYSSFRVGAALACADGAVVTGCNVENASYGLTVCAERNALAAAIAQGHRAFTALAVVADGAVPPTPCGACRQVLAEFCPPEFPVHCAAATHLDAAAEFTLGNLLPSTFSMKGHTA